MSDPAERCRAALAPRAVARHVAIDRVVLAVQPSSPVQCMNCSLPPGSWRAGCRASPGSPSRATSGVTASWVMSKPRAVGAGVVMRAPPAEFEELDAKAVRRRDRWTVDLGNGIVIR